MNVVLRAVDPSDLPLFFAQMRDPEAVRMAAFTTEDPADRAAFDALWDRILTRPDAVVRTVLADGTVAGNALAWGPPGEQTVGYWIDRAYWGRGVASAALRQLLGLIPIPDRPVHARVAADNAGSLRVLEKCGFTVTGHERNWAPGRRADTDEVLLTLHA